MQIPRLQDGRPLEQWESVYDVRAKIGIWAETVYVLFIMLASLALVGFSALAYYFEAASWSWVAQWTSSSIPETTNDSNGLTHAFAPVDVMRQPYLWIATLAAGTCAGSMFTLKWLYHCVARKLWHVDRRVWRISAPIISGILALFVVMLVRSGILPVVDSNVLSSFSGSVGLAFLIGLFSDNILAALQNLANQTFGTLRDRKRDVEEVPPTDENARVTETQQIQPRMAQRGGRETSAE